MLLRKSIHLLVVEIQNGIATLEDSLTASDKSECSLIIYYGFNCVLPKRYT